MKLNLFKKIKFTAANLAVATMVLSPVAQGKEAEKISRSKLADAVQSLGLNKSMTLAEFYKKNKQYYPERVQKDMDKLVAMFGNEPMPTFEVDSTKTSDGSQVPVMRISGNGQLHNVQFFGDENKYVKFDNTNLTEADIVNFTDMFEKLYNGDARLRKQVKGDVTAIKNVKKTVPAKKEFSGTPKITKESWKKMTPMQRAQFMVNMRLLWSGAQAVLDSKPSAVKKSGGKKTSSLDFNVLDKWNMFIALLNQDANANERPGDKCVIAGYIGTYGKSTRGGYSCQYPKENVAAAGCSYPCNPTIYGYGSDGKTFCVNDLKSLQTATHWNGACDKQSPLSLAQLPLPEATAAKDSSRYSGAEQRNFEAAAADANNLALTKNYLDSILNSESPELKAAFAKGEMSEDLLKKLLEIQTNFDNTIKAARADCAAAADNKNQYDREFWGACDQLHRRFLFVGAYLRNNPGCGGESDINPETLKCTCGTAPEVLPGQGCGANPVTGVDPANPGSGGQVDDPNAGQCDPQCSADQKCKMSAKDGEGAEVWECVGGKDNNKEKPGFWSKVGSFFKKAAPWLVGGLALFAVYKFLTPDKKKRSAAADRCPNGTIPPCGQICSPPKALLASGVCGCASCPPGQTITNASTCTCSSTNNTTPTTITCADGVTVVTDLANCPSTTTYSCWDGSTVANPIECPEQPSSKPAGTAQ